MTQKEKQLLLKDLSARLSYGVKVLVKSHKGTFNGTLVTVTTKVPHIILGEAWIEETNEALWCDYGLFKPYLRPMSSMTEEEKHELYNIRPYFINSDDIVSGTQCNTFIQASECQDWLNAHHFDYRGLIPLGLALEAPEGMYETK